jgi:hypothetical protein
MFSFILKSHELAVHCFTMQVTITKENSIISCVNFDTQCPSWLRFWILFPFTKFKNVILSSVLFSESQIRESQCAAKFSL